MIERLRDFALGSTSKSFSDASEGPLPDFPLVGVPGRRLTGATQRRHLQSYGGTDAIDWVMDCVDLYAQTASNANYFFYKAGSPGKGGHSKPKPLQRPPQDLVNLFNEPNPYQDYTELLELAVIDFLATGEFMWLKFRMGNDPNSPQFGKPLALYRLNPAWVEIEFDENNRPESYVYQEPGGGKEARFSPDSVVHVKRPNPHDTWRGLSIISSSPRAFDIELALTEAVASYYENGTRPSGALQSDRTVPPSTWKKIKRQFSQLYTKAANAGSVVMLDKGITYVPMSADASKAEFADMAELSMKRIAKAFRVPLPLIGETASSSDRQAVREAQRIFDNKTMRPFLNRMQSQISSQLTAAWGLDFHIDYEYTMPIEDKLDLGQALAIMPGVRVEEVRKQIDLEPLGDIRPEWKAIDDIILNLPGQPTDGEGGHADNNLGGEAGRHPNPENTVAFPQDGSLPPTANAVTAKSLPHQILLMRQQAELLQAEGGDNGDEG